MTITVVSQNGRSPFLVIE